MTKKALITGASRGLGHALATELAAAGWDLILTARDPGALALAAGSLRARSSPRQVRPVPGDVTSPVHRAALAEAVGGRLDLLVNNAGTLGTAPLPRLETQPLEDLETALQTNTIAPLALIQALLPALRSRHGTITNITSDAAVEPYRTWGGYGLTKAALEHLSAVLAVEEPELTVWWVDPGEMRTQMLADAMPDDDLSGIPRPAKAARALACLIAKHPPSGRYQLTPASGGAHADPTVSAGSSSAGDRA